jgi:hypothetical protein
MTQVNRCKYVHDLHLRAHSCSSRLTITMVFQILRAQGNVFSCSCTFCCVFYRSIFTWFKTIPIFSLCVCFFTKEIEKEHNPYFEWHTRHPTSILKIYFVFSRLPTILELCVYFYCVLPPPPAHPTFKVAQTICRIALNVNGY